jgi:uncharacterized Zn-binding protein involved in type VI secretion
MKQGGRGAVRLNDKTDHGGQVISVSSATIVTGKEAALAGDMTFCPRCKGNFTIKPDGAGAEHEGRPYAYNNHLTAGGAKVISSV